MQATEHLEAIKELVDHLAAKNLLQGETQDNVLRALREREDQISTGIGYGVAIPHAFSEKIQRVVCIFGRSSEGIDFEALDNAPVKFIVLFLVPEEQHQKHLQTLAAIAKLFTNCEVRKQLAAAENTHDILKIFASRPSRTDLER
jgi:mannitol/fructose-specific phosphotransferase system IIA component (Ntr-type)